MEGLDWGNSSSAPTFFGTLGLPSPLWSTLTAHESSKEFSAPSHLAAECYYPQDFSNNPMENGRMVVQTMAFENEFGCFRSFSGADVDGIRIQQEELALLASPYCFKSPLLQEDEKEEALGNHQIPALVEPLNRNVSSANTIMTSTADGPLISSCQIQIINDSDNSIISSNKSFWTASWGGGGAISSDSTEQDESVSQSSAHQLCKKRKSPELTGCSFGVTGEKYLCFNSSGSEFSPDKSGFKLITEDYSDKQKKLRSGKQDRSSNINFMNPNSLSLEPDTEAIATMKEMVYRAAALRPINLGPEIFEKPKRKNVRISSDPQTVAARQRRERIGERIRILQRLVPGGTKMDTATMLEEAANYLKFLKSQVSLLQSFGTTAISNTNYHHDVQSLPPSKDPN